MFTYLRYSLAMICFALCVACLGLWGWTRAASTAYVLASRSSFGQDWSVAAVSGTAVVCGVQLIVPPQPSSIHLRLPDENARMRGMLVSWQAAHTRAGLFGEFGRSIYFPLWYAALVFALAGVGTLRLGRRFTLRSAIIATTAVAGLLGMAVAL